ncbi:alpha/beta hydrolase family protein [Nocardia sp. NPDC050175]|uniref:alpha/beta hydrolase family protein n=1 Tax=Nocardia sp. NPDC050175 TaxID=3364317 RepID=UPI0037A13DB0
MVLALSAVPWPAVADGPAGGHGSVISTRSLTADPGIPEARNYLVSYRSVDAHGQPVEVSGTLAVPQGQPPAGGWPLISWAHGTTGVADVCAPSRDTGPDYLSHDYTSLVRDVQAKWVAAGYALAQTDYQGLGTDGAHGYLIGTAEQRAVADLALAAREIDPAVGTRWVAIGHSQGGQAAVFADAQAQGWVPELQLLGAVALAPASHLGPAIEAAKLAANAGGGQLPGNAAFLPLLIRGAQTVAEIDPARFLTPKALALLPQADDRCIGQLRGEDSWGGLRAGEVFTRDADTRALTRVLNDNDPSSLTFTTPLLVLQGRSDTTVAPQGTDAMVAQQLSSGQPVNYRNYPGIDHRGVLDASFDDALVWVNARFGR